MSSLMPLRLRAESGDPQAQHLLAIYLLYGLEGQTPQPSEAYRLLDAACAQNHQDSILLHAAMAARGYGRPKSLTEAYDLVMRAAALGNASAEGQIAALGGDKGFDLDAWRTPPEVAIHFHAPRIFTFERFIPESACAWMSLQYRKRLERAGVLSAKGKIAIEGRSNSLAPLMAFEPDLVAQLIKMRIADLSGLNVMHQEPMNILHYSRGQHYGAHYDYSTGAQAETFKNQIARVGTRIGTCLIYLNEGYEGGETRFPGLDWSFKGKTGDALFFWSATSHGELERLSLHEGLPVIKGDKWLLSQWIRARQVPLNWDPAWSAGQ